MWLLLVVMLLLPPRAFAGELTDNLGLTLMDYGEMRFDLSYNASMELLDDHVCFKDQGCTVTGDWAITLPDQGCSDNDYLQWNDTTELWECASSVADHVHTFHDVLGDGEAGAVWTLSNTPSVGTERLFLNALSLRRKTSAPGVNEYTISGSEVTLWESKTTSDHLEADYLQ